METKHSYILWYNASKEPDIWGVLQGPPYQDMHELLDEYAEGRGEPGTANWNYVSEFAEWLVSVKGFEKSEFQCWHV